MRKEVIGDCTLFLGDCLEILPSLDGDKVDLIISDLPYGTTNCKWDSSLPLDLLWKLYRKLTNAPVILFAQTPFDKVLGVSNIQELRYEWIWEKSNATGHLNAKRAPLKAHENILVFYKNLPTYNPIKTIGNVRKQAVKTFDRSEVYGKQFFTTLPYNSMERYPRSVLRFPSDKQTSSFHPTQNPVALCEYLIKTYSEKDYLIMDNCMGSGTTGVACVKQKKKFLGIEKEEKYFDISCRRIEEAYNQKTLCV